LTLDVTELAQAIPEGSEVGSVENRRNGLEHADAPQLPLLRVRRERPRSRYAAEQRDEVAAFPLTEMHPIPHGRGAHRRIPDCSGSVSGWVQPAPTNSTLPDPQQTHGELSRIGLIRYGAYPQREADASGAPRIRAWSQ